ncbi:unnamed protein product [Gongylonema pulchrum]|uniref:FBD domain-containing protein n=1 Tax=Gongylonema pulchrum TaxID=637853 RepID=A0A183EAS3_9BILA|nr:unnamed protein product [Gongylonema pulchrum]
MMLEIITDLLQLAAAVPNLDKLDLSQISDKPCFKTNAVLALPYFRKLKTLIIDGFVARETAGKGCSHRLEVPPLHHMQHLEALELNCSYDTLSKILHSLRESNAILYNLKRVHFGVKHCSAIYLELLTWFLSEHRSLRSVRISNALFATTVQLRRFYE